MRKQYFCRLCRQHEIQTLNKSDKFQTLLSKKKWKVFGKQIQRNHEFFAKQFIWWAEKNCLWTTVVTFKIHLPHKVSDF